MGVRSKITHFAPPSDLRYPWYSLFGFKGSILHRDSDVREPMSKIYIFIGTLALLIFGGVWAITRYLKELKDKIS
jgi:hypothetical protein